MHQAVFTGSPCLCLCLCMRLTPTAGRLTPKQAGPSSPWSIRRCSWLWSVSAGEQKAPAFCRCHNRHNIAQVACPNRPLSAVRQVSEPPGHSFNQAALCSDKYRGEKVAPLQAKYFSPAPCCPTTCCHFRLASRFASSYLNGPSSTSTAWSYPFPGL